MCLHLWIVRIFLQHYFYPSKSPIHLIAAKEGVLRGFAILGVLITVAWTFDVAEHVAGGAISGGAVICGTMAIAGLLIVWHAWRWPAPADQSLPERRPAASPDQRAAKPA